MFEYGIAWKEIAEDNIILFIHRCSHGKNFDRTSFDKNIDIKKEFNWMKDKDWGNFFDYLGLGEVDRAEYFTDLVPLQVKIQDLMNYYGVENIFGSTYWEGFEITKD